MQPALQVGSWEEQTMLLLAVRGTKMAAAEYLGLWNQ